jgi:putative IMPACT (imprinted ancient) family translation regulator
VCVGVIRYYGGVNLGTGGLARAYGGTAKIALEAASTLPFVEMQLLKLTIQYNRMDELTRTLTQLKGKILNKTFDDAVHVEISLPAIEINAFKNRFS